MGTKKDNAKTAFSKLYKKYFIDKSDERRMLFEKIAKRFQITSALYPGSFVHVTPSLSIRKVTYIDNDRRCTRFFQDANTMNYVYNNRNYTGKPVIKFISADFTKTTNLKKEKFDLLISLYAGFISQYCKKHLEMGGVLLANNSHGDAALAYLDNSFKLIAVMKRSRNDNFSIIESSLEDYFILAGTKKIDKDKIMQTMKGPQYTQSAYAYVFRKENT